MEGGGGSPSVAAGRRERISEMRQARSDLRHAGSAAANIHSFMSDRVELGEIVAWVFNNEMEGFRIK